VEQFKEGWYQFFFKGLIEFSRESIRLMQNIVKLAGRLWLTPVILGTQEAEIRRIAVQSQLGQIVCETLS
jgi:hypothetical protein